MRSFFPSLRVFEHQSEKEKINFHRFHFRHFFFCRSVLKVSRYACSIHACVNTIHPQNNDEHQDRNARGFTSGGSGTLLELRGGRGSTERGGGRGDGGRGRGETPQGSGFSTPVHQNITPNNNENNVNNVIC